MPRKQADIEKGLKAKGFSLGTGDHNYFLYVTKAGKKTAVFTKTSHGSKEISDNLLAKMARQVKLSRSEFDLLVDCPLDRDAYEKKLAAQNYIA
jgi:hypothetical protein